jgi:hypothetical protein
MVLVGDVYVMSCPHIMTNINSQVADYPASASNQTPVANAHDWIG